MGVSREEKGGEGEHRQVDRLIEIGTRDLFGQ